ncbi:hypothetical protein FNX48_020915, partial [Streptomyces sp. IF17]|nr:hypothetical protein [Streptomyces alkaliphilus]
MRMFRTTPPTAHPGEGVNRLLLVAGAVAGPIFLPAVLLQDLIRPHYDPLRHPISSHALGGAGWVQ